MPIPRSLHLTSLKLRNFKGIAELHLAFDESLTLLAGVNGVGKTSVMQALVAAVTHTWHRNPPHNYPCFMFPERVVRAGAAGTEIVLEVVVPDQPTCQRAIRIYGTTVWNLSGRRGSQD